MSWSCSRYIASGTPTATASSIMPIVESIESPIRAANWIRFCLPLGFRIDLRALLHELDGFLLQPFLDVVAHVLRDLHRAEMRAAHRAEVRHLHAVFGQRLVVEVLGRVGIEPQVELVLPAELEARLGDRVVADLRPGMALGEVGGV